MPVPFLGPRLKARTSQNRAAVCRPHATNAPSVEDVKAVLEEASSSNRQAAREARAFRRGLNQQPTYTRRTKNDKESLARMEDDGVGYSTSGLVAQMRANGHTFELGDVSVYLAEAYGFCWGVERAVQMAYEARQAFPDRQLHITNEIIHNPGVNERMTAMGVKFVEVVDEQKDFSQVESGDVVILPAFGASVQEMRLLADRGVQIVDTTCPWVAKVWTAVDKQANKMHTSIIHGKYAHEETVATASFAGDYVIVKDMAEASYVADYILNGGDKQEFLAKFVNAVSKNFDPDTMLDRVGIANQTTMLKGETQAIGKLFEKAMMTKFGPEALNDHFMVMDTICDATQERQDAMYALTSGDTPVDIMLVVGGFNSSNTSHLQEIAEHKDIPSFWVCSADCIDVEKNSVQCKVSWGEIVMEEPWLTTGQKLRMGVTLGASTPGVEDVQYKVSWRELKTEETWLTKEQKLRIRVTAGAATHDHDVKDVQYKTSWGELKREEPWLTKGQQLRIGVTSGASTPDRDVEDVLDRVFRIMVPDYSGIASKEVGAPPKPTH